MTLQQAINIIKNGRASLNHKTIDALCSDKRKWKQLNTTSMVTKYNGLSWTVQAISDTALRIFINDSEGAGGVVHASI